MGCTNNPLIWCSTKNNDYAKDSLNWEKPRKDGYCVNIFLAKADSSDPQLRYADCLVKKRFICEVVF
jgi:hypothetical protein